MHLLFLIALLLAAGCGAIPESGRGVAAADRPIREFMARWNVPGLALAVAVDERLVLARGYGFADPESGEPVRPDSLFRIASASKPVTAIAVMTLVERGELALDARVFETLLPAYRGRCHTVDPRLARITVRHLLVHASGWDTTDTGDPMFNAARVARRLDIEGLTVTEGVIQYMVCSPLQFAPGTRHAYENVNYAVLGRVIEAVAGKPYEAYVRERVFAPLGIEAPRVGGSERSERLPGEVVYVARGADRRRLPSAVDDSAECVPLPYGRFDLAAMDSHGGWVASTPDLLRLMAGINGRDHVADILGPQSVTRMGGNPGPPLYDADARTWYAMGWYRTREGAWLHDGSLPGSASIMGMESDGLIYAALANTRYPGPDVADGLRHAVRSAVRAVRARPDGDLFPVLGYGPEPSAGAGDRP